MRAGDTGGEVCIPSLMPEQPATDLCFCVHLPAVLSCPIHHVSRPSMRAPGLDFESFAAYRVRDADFQCRVAEGQSAVA